MGFERESYDTKKSYSKSKFVLLVGIVLVLLAISFSILASIDYTQNRKFGKTEILSKNQIISIDLEESTLLGYSYVIEGKLYMNSTKPFYVFYGNQSGYFENQSMLNLYGSDTIVTIQAIYDNTTFTYSANYVLEVRPYLGLSIPSFFILIIGTVFTFMGLYQYLLLRRQFS